MGRRGNTGKFALAVLVACLAGSSALAQQPNQIDDLFAKARPHLEAVLGTRLEKLPQFQVVTVEQLRQVADPDLEACVHWRFPDLTPEALAHAAEVVRFVSANAAVARHIEGSDTICVVPDNLPRIADWDRSLQAANSPAFLQLALVHEVARFVLDRRYELARRRGECRDREEFVAWQAIVEGRAQWITSEVARRLGTQATFPLLAERWRYVPDAGPDPALRTYSQTAIQVRHWAYAQGLIFFSYLQDKRLTDLEKRAFTRPPRHVRWLERPELYLRAEQSNRPDLSSALRTLEQALPAAEWSAAQQSWTPGMVKQVAGLFAESERAERVTGTWDEGRTLVWTMRKAPGRMVALSVVRHETPAGAKAYFGFAVALQRKQEQLVGTDGPTIRIVESKSTALRLPGVEEAVRLDKQMQFGKGSTPVAVTTVLARAGDVVLECSWHGQQADPAWTESVVRGALAAVK